MTPLDTPPAESAAPIRERWGDALNAGFVAVPVLLVRHQKDLGLTDGEFVVLLNVLTSWWEGRKLPFPSTQTMAKRMGVTPRTVQRHLASLELRGLLRPMPRSTVAETDTPVVRYDPSGLVVKLQKLGARYLPRQPRTAQVQAGEGVPA